MVYFVFYFSYLKFQTTYNQRSKMSYLIDFNSISRGKYYCNTVIYNNLYRKYMTETHIHKYTYIHMYMYGCGCAF